MADSKHENSPGEKARRPLLRQVASMLFMVAALSGWGMLAGIWTARWVGISGSATATGDHAESTHTTAGAEPTDAEHQTGGGGQHVPAVLVAGEEHPEVAAELVGRDRYLLRAEETLVEGNVAAAARMFELILETTPGPTDPAIVYRLAICQELAGDFAAALKLYQKIAASGQRPWVLAAAALGQARVHLAQGNLALAEQLLTELLVTRGPQNDFLGGDVAHLLAQTQARRATSSLVGSLIDDRQFAVGDFRWSAADLLKRYSNPEVLQRRAAANASGAENAPPDGAAPDASRNTAPAAAPPTREPEGAESHDEAEADVDGSAAREPITPRAERRPLASRRPRLKVAPASFARSNGSEANDSSHGGPAHGDAAHADAAHTDAAHADAAHTDAAHADAAHDDAAHGDTAQADAAHDDAAHDDAAHGDAAHADAAHDSPAHADETHGSPAPGNAEHAADAHHPGPSPSEEARPASPTAEHPTAEHSTAEHPTAEHSTAEHPTADHPAADHPAAEHSKTEPPAAATPRGKSPAYKPPRLKKRRAPAGLQLVRKWGPTPDDMLFSCDLEHESVQQAVQRLATLAELTVEWSSVATESVVSRTTSASVAEIPGALLLDVMLSPSSLVWQLEDGKLVIRAQREADGELLLQCRRSAARRAIQYAATKYHDHPLAVLSQQCLGNMLFSEDQIEAAAVVYEQSATDHAQSPLAAELWFNLAKCWLLQGRLPEARDAWYRLVDGHRSHPLTGIAYLYIGRVHMELREPAQAVRPLKEATYVTLGDIKAAAVITLAAAYVESNSPGPANQVLMQYRDLLKESKYRRPAAFLSAWTQYVVAGSPTETIQRGRALVTAIQQTDPSQFFSRDAYLLYGESLSKLGLEEHLIQTYRAGLAADPPSQIRNQMLLDLCGRSLSEAMEDEITPLLQQLAGESGGSWGRRAELELAQIDFRRGNYDACLTRYSRLLTLSRDDQEKAGFLRAMGRVFEKKNEPDQAARCFAGLVPLGFPFTATTSR